MSARRVDQGMAAVAAGLLPAEVKSELRTRYRQLRVMLHSAGLAASYAFIAAKARGERGELAESYADVAGALRVLLADRGLLTGDPAALSPSDVLQQLGGLDVARYARASREAAALVGWLSRLADASYQAAAK